VVRDAWRVVQIAVKKAGKPDTFGSGYLVHKDVVLTARHVVAGRSPGDCSVRFPGATDPAVPPVGVEEIWEGGADCDLAVLSTSRVESPVFVNGSLFGRLTRAPEEASAVTMGYPRWKRRRREVQGRSRTFRSLTHLSGRLKLTTLHTAAGLEFVIEDHPPGADEDGPWGAMSGAPVWVGHRLVAVVTEHHCAEGAARLVVQPVQDMYSCDHRGRGARAIRAVGLPRSLDDLQLAVGHVAEYKPRGPGVTPIVRYVLESDFLPRRALVEGTPYTVGRGPDNEIVVDRIGVGGRHCKMWVHNDGGPTGYSVYVQDLGSVNGTQVNGEQLDMFVPHRLVGGDNVTLGVEATFCLRAVQRRF
jgi:hypothetical protein